MAPPPPGLAENPPCPSVVSHWLDRTYQESLPCSSSLCYLHSWHIAEPRSCFALWRVGGKQTGGREGLSRDRNDKGHAVALFFCTELPYMISRKGFFFWLFFFSLWIEYTPDIKYTGSAPELKHTKKTQQKPPPPKSWWRQLMKLMQLPGQKKPAWIANDKEPTEWNKTEDLVYLIPKTTGLQKWVRVKNLRKTQALFKLTNNAGT